MSNKQLNDILLWSIGILIISAALVAAGVIPIPLYRILPAGVTGMPNAPKPQFGAKQR